MKTLSVVIPVYNEARYIQRTLAKVMSAKPSSLKKEIIIVDDGSTDTTAKKIKEFIARHKKPRKASFIFHQKRRNEGKGTAVKIGISKSSGALVLIQDADLEYSPDDYPALLEPLLKGQADAVYGSRLLSNKPHRVLYFWHYVGNVALTTFSNIFTNLNLSDMETGYKVFDGKIIRSIAPRLVSRRFGFEPEVTARLAKIPEVRIYEVGISYSGRTYREGKKIGWVDGVKALVQIVRFNLFG